MMLATGKWFLTSLNRTATASKCWPSGPLRVALGDLLPLMTAIMLVFSAIVPAWAAEGAMLTSPCYDSRIDPITFSDLSTNAFRQLSEPQKVSSLQHGDGVGDNGCFSQWMPMQPIFDPNLLAELGEIRPSIEDQLAQNEDFSTGLIDRLQSAWEQNRFDFANDIPNKGFQFGNIASLETEREMVLALLEQVANNLIPSSTSGSPTNRNTAFTFNLNNIPLNSQTLIGGSSVFSVDEYLNVFLEDLTITVSNGTISGETQLNPETLSPESGSLSLDLNIGNARVSSTTTFEKDQGVTKQVLNMSAGLGQLNLHSQVTLSLNRSEFRLGASISDLAIGMISTIDANGNQSQTFELEINF